MRSPCQLLLIAIVTIHAAQPALAAEPLQPNRTQVPATLTGKERLGRKWMDEQRIDNCNVPPDKRGSKPRPVACAHPPAS